MTPAAPVITDIAQLDSNESYTYADYLRWDYPPYVELIHGRASIRPTPWTRHQQCLGNLAGEIGFFLKKHPRRNVQAYPGPLDVRLKATRSDDRQTDTVVLPDFFVATQPGQLDELGCIGPPAWIIEVLSPATAARDTQPKYCLYAENGVAEYWIVFPGEQSISTFVLKEGDYELAGEYYEPGLIPSHTLPELQLQWAAVFESLS